ncbi:MAG: hypothetical protein HYX51_11940 [Chloroflexi bacterium]|nr:hypothetical protein [Chloroflexota bacterium]
MRTPKPERGDDDGVRPPWAGGTGPRRRRRLRRAGGQRPRLPPYYRADPVGALRAVGVPEIAIADALRETGYAEPEVAGFVAGFPALTGSLPPDIDPAILAECGFTCLWTAGPPLSSIDGAGPDNAL